MPQNYNAFFLQRLPLRCTLVPVLPRPLQQAFFSKKNDVVVFTGDNTTGVWNQTPQTDYGQQPER